ncbi:hypothetical protein Fcan01_22758 [Folsomia candida]|uniref:Uncharacterized protein n=1 Tax=Folsomia candida TaxID=158441 RepID=A0A226DA78_FOLCA|nr:hypothetical protein Fcan01_22758 [Folsomia candida]
MLAFLYLLKHSYYLIPLAIFGLILIDPCAPPFILSMHAGCSDLRGNGLVILILLLETYLCFCLFYIGTAPIVHNLFAGISSLLSYFQLLEREIPMPVFLIFPVILVDASVNNILVFTLASWVFNSSVKYLKGVEKMTLQFRSQSLIRKQLKSCGTLKIKFGSNFIDNGTPLIVLVQCLVPSLAEEVSREERKVKPNSPGTGSGSPPRQATTAGPSRSRLPPQPGPPPNRPLPPLPRPRPDSPTLGGNH